jgi:hypothetical protein
MTKQKTNSEKKEEIKETLPILRQPLIFISHDTRDGELAEEFSNLLKSASAGALKSFRSSDKKGTEGIEYGSEWYPAIMDKIEEASDVVCLLTQHSLNRPWLLYEAGVAKGKLNKKVIGLALGIPLQSVLSGPFAQFQNNNGDVDAITKLVIDLVKKVPGLDPDQGIVKTLVEAFVNKSNVITEKIQKEFTTSQKKENVDETSIAKLFEEVKIMFDDLPSRIENKIDPEYRRKKRRFHPMLFDEIIHFSKHKMEKNIGFLMMLSFFKDDFPWFYEIGLETYRGIKNSKNNNEKMKIINSFTQALKLLDHPMWREFSRENFRDKEAFMIFEESRHFFMKYIDLDLLCNENETLSKSIKE